MGFVPSTLLLPAGLGIVRGPGRELRDFKLPLTIKSPQPLFFRANGFEIYAYFFPENNCRARF